MRDDCDEEGQELSISMEGVSYSEPDVTAKQILYHVRKFLIYLLVPSNMILRKIVSSAFEVMAPAVQRYPGCMSFSEPKLYSRMRFPSTDLQSQEA